VAPLAQSSYHHHRFYASSLNKVTHLRDTI
jgi:hypothetical protein